MVFKVLIKTIARSFYYENAGAFIIIFLLAFGFLSGNEHKAIAMTIASDSSLCLLTVCIWSAYIIKTIVFFYGKLHFRLYHFVWNISSLPVMLRTLSLLAIQGVMSLPVSLYALFVLQFGWQSESTFPVLILSIFLLIIHIIPVILYGMSLKNYHYEQNNYIISRLNNLLFSLKKPEWSWPVIGSLKDRPALWLVSKPAAILLLIGFSVIDSVEHYDIKWMSLGTLVVFSINVSLLFEINSFKESYLGIFKNLPIPKYRILLHDSVVIFSSLIPEVVLMIKLFPGHHTYKNLIMLLIFGFLLNWISYLDVQLYKMNLEDYLRKYFFIFISLFIAIISGVPIIIVAFVFALGLAIVYANYYQLTLPLSD